MSTRRSSALGPCLAGLAVILVVAAYTWTCWAEGGFHLSRGPGSYYGYLTEAFLSGQTSLKLAPDPRLAQLANPWEGYQGIPRIHDASYYHGKYYLYFGAAPVALFFAPIRLLTGLYPGEGAAGCAFGLAGFLLGLVALRRALRPQLALLAPGWIALGILLWGFSTHAFVVAQAAIFYSVPILCAFMCLMAALVALGGALEAATRGKTLVWVGLSSLAWGLSVASRPHYLYSLPMILAGVWLVRTRDPGASRGSLLAAAVIPAGGVGILLALYNFVRFGSPIEFGQHYQFAGNSSDAQGVTYFHPAAVLPHLRSYLFASGEMFLHFPVVVADPAWIGILAWMPFIGLGVLAPLAWRWVERSARRQWTLLFLCGVVPSILHLLGLSLIPIGYGRYDVDFAPGLMLAALAATAVLLASPRFPGSALRRMFGLAVGLLALVSLLKPWAMVLDATPDARARTLAVGAEERVASWIEALFHLAYGPVQATVQFDALPTGRSTRLLQTGNGDDWLSAERLSIGKLRLSFTHQGDPPLFGIPFEAKAGSPMHLTVDLGSFYPPDHHPLFRGWDPAVVEALHRRVQASVDGQTVLSGNSSFYPTDPLRLRWGARSIPGCLISLTDVEQGPPPSQSEVAATGWTGPLRMVVTLPKFESPHSEPLVATGTHEAGELVYIVSLKSGRYRFGLDTATGGSVESTDVDLDPNAPHVLEIDFGALRHEQPAEDFFNLKVDGHWLLHVATRSLASRPYQVVFGYNANKDGLSVDAFAGQILSTQRIAPLVYTGHPIEGIGAITAMVTFTASPAAISEPLVVSGVQGKGDIVYVRQVDGRRFRFGEDHWSVGAKESDPVDVEPGKPHHLEVWSASFLPPLGSPEWGRVTEAEQRRLSSSIRVLLDGKVVLVAPWEGYPTSVYDITLGTNSLGGSSASAVFSGTITNAKRRLP